MRRKWSTKKDLNGNIVVESSSESMQSKNFWLEQPRIQDKGA